MNLVDLNPPFIELPPNTVWHRIQRLRYRGDSVRTRGFIMPPAGTLAGRFDLVDEPTAYLADSELTALYESLFRRDARTCTLAQLRDRALVSFRTTPGLRLVDVRGLAEPFPVLQSLRYATTQGFAAEFHQAGAHGVLYASSQHPLHGCICLFPDGVAHMSKVSSLPLVKPGTDRLHRSVVDAALGAQMTVVP